MLFGSRVVSASHAIECAEAGEVPLSYAVKDPRFAGLYEAALAEVRQERARRDAKRARYDRIAAGLLAATRLRETMEHLA